MVCSNLFTLVKVTKILCARLKNIVFEIRDSKVNSIPWEPVWLRVPFSSSRICYNFSAIYPAIKIYSPKQRETRVKCNLNKVVPAWVFRHSSSKVLSDCMSARSVVLGPYKDYFFTLFWDIIQRFSSLIKNASSRHKWRVDVKITERKR